MPTQYEPCSAVQYELSSDVLGLDWLARKSAEWLGRAWRLQIGDWSLENQARHQNDRHKQPGPALAFPLRLKPYSCGYCTSVLYCPTDMLILFYYYTHAPASYRVWRVLVAAPAQPKSSQSLVHQSFKKGLYKSRLPNCPESFLHLK